MRLRFVVLICTLIACHNRTESTQEKEEKTKKKITSRDYSITPLNSYSDLFLDSSSLINFIENQRANDTIARRMVSFYNSRNYQFAWFLRNGLTEQGLFFWNLY